MRIPNILKQIREAKLEFIPTGFPRMDEELDGGFLRRELVVIGGSSGVGKSFLASQLVLNIAEKGFRCLYLSLEISNQTIVSRMLGSLAALKPARIVGGLLTEEEYQRKLDAEAELLSRAGFIDIYDNVYELSKIAKIIEEAEADFVVIDFIQNVISAGDREYERMSKVSLELQRLAKSTNSCILVLSQLSNQVVREGGEGPALEYKGAGTIAQVCDLGFWLWREKVEDYSQDRESEELMLILRKNRRGFSLKPFSLIMKLPGGEISEK
jgi:replicative DNA helicase